MAVISTGDLQDSSLGSGEGYNVATRVRFSRTVRITHVRILCGSSGGQVQAAVWALTSFIANGTNGVLGKTQKEENTNSGLKPLNFALDTPVRVEAGTPVALGGYAIFPGLKLSASDGTYTAEGVTLEYRNGYLFQPYPTNNDVTGGAFNAQNNSQIAMFEVTFTPEGGNSITMVI